MPWLQSVSRFIKERGPTVRLVARVGGGGLALFGAFGLHVPFGTIKDQFTIGTVAQSAPITYTRLSKENFPPSTTKTIVALCDATDTAMNWELAPVDTRDAAPYQQDAQPVVSNDGRRIGYKVTYFNGAGTSMGHPNVDFIVKVNCQASTK